MTNDRDGTKRGREPDFPDDAALGLPGGLEAALGSVDRILEQDPNDARAIRLQGRLRERLCWTSGVLDPADRLVDLYPSESDTRRLVELHRHAINADRALALLDRLPERGVSWEIERAEILVESRRFREAVVIADRLSADPRVDVESVLRLAHLSLVSGDASVTLMLARRALDLAPDDVGALLLSGKLALWSGDIARARGLAERILDNDRRCKQALQLKGQCELVAQNFPSAIGLLQAAVDADEPNLETLISLAEALRLDGQTGAARTLLREARALQPGYVFALDANELLVFRSRWRIFALAFRFFSPGNRPDLLSTLCGLKLLDSFDALERPKVSLATVLAVLGEALPLLSGNRSPTLTRRSPAPEGFECVAPGPPERTACVQVHRVLRTQGIEAALSAYQRLLSDYRGSPVVYTYRGECLLWAGQYEAARLDFEAALRGLPSARWAWVGLGASHLLSGDPGQALRTFARGRRHVMPATVTDVYAGEALRGLGRRRAALAAFRRAQGLNPERPSVHVNLAIQHAELGDVVRVEEHLSAVRKSLPSFLRSLLQETGNHEASFTADLDRCRAALNHGLEMMRGNRSRSEVTWFRADGRLYAEFAAGPMEAVDQTDATS